MGNARLLEHEEILKVRAAVISAGLIGSRTALLAGMDPAFVAELYDAPAPGQQALTDLDTMNTAGSLADGTTPLATWLSNAIALTEHRKEAKVFQRALELCGSGHARKLQEAPTGLDRDALLIPQFQSRSEARAWLEERLLANRVIHSEFGPDADYQFNPESEMASVWRRKVVQHVIPRNRQILAALDVNAFLLAPHEKVIREMFRQHVDDQEAFHIWGNTTIRKRFPSEVEGLFRD
jgi:hypothetical protein